MTPNSTWPVVFSHWSTTQLLCCIDMTLVICVFQSSNLLSTQQFIYDWAHLHNLKQSVQLIVGWRRCSNFIWYHSGLNCDWTVDKEPSLWSCQLPSVSAHSLYALIAYHIDYCNTVLYMVTSTVIWKLQATLHASKQLFTHIWQNNHMMPKLCACFWVHNFYVWHMTLYVANFHYISMISAKICFCYFGPCSFRVLAPQIWNVLPSHFSDITISHQVFRLDLKTWLFVPYPYVQVELLTTNSYCSVDEMAAYSKSVVQLSRHASEYWV